MPLQRRNLEFPFASGIDRGTHEFHVQPPGLILLDNGRIDKSGSVNKRDGYSVLTTLNSTPHRLMTNGRALLGVEADSASNTAYRISAVTNDGATARIQGLHGPAHAVTEAQIKHRWTVGRDTTYSQKNSDIGISGNYKLIAWEMQDSVHNTTRVRAVVIDNDNGAVVVPEQEVSTSAATTTNCRKPRVVVSTDKIYVYYAADEETDINAAEFTISTLTWDSDSTIFSDSNGTPVFDAAADEAGTGVYFVARRTGTGTLVLSRFAADTKAQSHGVEVGLNEDPDECISVSSHTTDGHVFVCWSESTNGVLCAVHSTTDASETTAHVTVRSTTGAEQIGMVRNIGSHRMIVWAYPPGSSTERSSVFFDTLDNSGNLGTTLGSASQLPRHNFMPISRPVVSGLTVYINVIYDAGYGTSGVEPSGFNRTSDGHSCVLTLAIQRSTIADASLDEQHEQWRPVARWLGNAAGSTRGASTLSNFVQNGSDELYEFVCEGDFKLQAADDGTLTTLSTTGTELCSVYLDSREDRWTWVNFGGSIHIDGGIHMVFDGAQVTEHLFHYPCEARMSVNPGAGSLTAGDYQVAVVYSWRSRDGRISRSAPIFATDSSGNTSLTVATNGAINVYFPYLTLTQKYNSADIDDLYTGALPQYDDCVVAEVYRTEAGGTILYLDGTSDPLPSAVYATSHATTYSVEEADATAANNEPLYTLKSLPNYPLPATHHSTVHRNRLFCIAAEDRKQLLFTQKLIEGQMPGWNPAFTIRVDDGGDMTALSPLDDKLIVFKKDSIFVLYGDGPDPLGGGWDFGEPQKLSADQGCIEKRSVVLTRDGVMFRSRDGIYLLDRSLQIQPIGDPISELISSYPDTTFATVVPDAQRVYFGVSDSAGTSGVVYVWDYGQRAWYQDTIAGSEGNSEPLSAVYHDGDELGGAFLYASFRGNTTVYKHTGNADPGTNFFGITIQTPWLKLSGIQGYQRARWMQLLMDDENAAGYQVEVKVGYDYASAWDRTYTFTAAELDAMDRKQPRIHIEKQRCQAVRFQIADLESGGDNPDDGPDFVGLSLEVGVKGGLRRVPDAHME